MPGRHDRTAGVIPEAPKALPGIVTNIGPAFFADPR